jgi:FkbM family methyltransferase
MKISLISKIKAIYKNVSNWYLIPFDKIFSGKVIQYKFRNGISIFCRSKSTDINEAIVILSGMEYPDIHLNSLFENSGSKVIFDLGGNIGSFVLYYDYLNSINFKKQDYKIYVFEPHPGNLNILKNNININIINNINNVEIIDKAVSGTAGVLKFDISGNFDSFKLSNESKNFIEVQSVILSEFCSNKLIKYIDLLKIDIEGGEYDILNKDLSFLESSVGLIIMEYHKLSSKKNKDYIIEKLSKTFNVSAIHGNDDCGLLVARNKYILSKINTLNY